MNLGTSSSTRPGHNLGAFGPFFLALLLWFFACLAGRAQQVQFDVFVGYGDPGGGGYVPEASWFPVVCEIKNNGPTFTGVIQVNSGNFGEAQNVRVAVELPTGTMKRISIPVFNAGRYQKTWDFRIVDDHNRVRAERPGAMARSTVASGTMLMGALPRTGAGTPIIRQVTTQSQEFQPVVARFVEAAIIPDNPLVWEAMDTVYVNSEKAPGLNDAQSAALEAWLNNGGHLIVAVEAVSDVNGTPWLKRLVPMDLNSSKGIKEHRSLQQWLRAPYSTPNSPATTRLRANPGFPSSRNSPFDSLNDDPEFENQEITVATGAMRGGQVIASAADGTPLIVSLRRGRGEVTVLLFDPERDPTRSWKNLPTFWARVANVPPDLYINTAFNQRTGYGIDGVFGAMIDSKQIRKLPVEWLLLLLILYLAVIGPLDQYWLKRIKRPMLTWITFPCYVVLFSVAIYFIGYKLRAGETEWNELHFVDVLPRDQDVVMRGRSYYSIYSPVNDTYRVQSDLAFAAFRGEFQGSWSTGSTDEHANVMQVGENFHAEIFVPVWTSQLYASDWWQPAERPFLANLAPDNQGWTLTVSNVQTQPLSRVRLVIGGTVYDMGDVPAGQSKTSRFTRGQGMPLGPFINNRATFFQAASQSRQRSFGNTASGQIQDMPDSSMAISLLGGEGNLGGGNENFIMPPGLDISPVLDRGQAVLLAWQSDFAPVKGVNQFPTKRSHKDTLWRLTLPLNPAKTPLESAP